MNRNLKATLVALGLLGLAACGTNNETPTDGACFAADGRPIACGLDNSGGNAGNSGSGGFSGNAGNGGQGGTSGNGGSAGNSGNGGSSGGNVDSGIPDANDASADVTSDGSDDGNTVDSTADINSDNTNTDASDGGLDSPVDVTVDIAPDITADVTSDSLEDGSSDAVNEPEAAAPNCGPGTKVCPDNPTQCTVILADSNHCGSDCQKCTTEQTCSMGQCVRNCSGSTPDSCGTYCARFASDPQNCGGCGNTCDISKGQACLGGLCLIGPKGAPCTIQDPNVKGLCKNGIVSDNGSMCVQQIKPGDLAEVCDGQDNDCNGLIDDGLEGSKCDTPNDGACKAGKLHCVAGVASCEQLNQPKPEVCDNVDNDCNGLVDDQPTDLGACHTGNPGLCDPGDYVCELGGIKKCIGLQPGTLPEICDGQDNDCNGLTDEPTVKDPSTNTLIVYGTNVSCNDSLTGICAAASKQCVNGALTCVPGKAPTAEVCNGLDDNCSGTVDENNPGGGGPCTVPGKWGACAPGTWNCLNGTLTCVPTQPNPVAETCDGVDNDCDNIVDNPPQNGKLPGEGVGCNDGLYGPCAQATMVCKAGKLTCTPSVSPQPETCNGVDDDCDNVVDDHITDPQLGTACVVPGGQKGPCQFSTYVCQNGSKVCPLTFVKGTETCDGVDNDCSGFIDDNLVDPRLGQTCTVTNPAPGIKGGPCLTSTTTCGPNGTIACNQSVIPKPELCNGTDDDCDGTIDDNLVDPNVGKTCTVPNLPASIAAGSPCSKSTSICSGGAPVCPFTVNPKPETCNTVDDDCNGKIDDNVVDVVQRASCTYTNPVTGTSSFPTKPTCSAGYVTACNAGTEDCSPLNVVGETCNGIDDDCDGVVDDAPSGSSLCVAPKTCKGVAGCQ